MPFPSLATRSTGYDVTATNWNDVINYLNSLREVNYTEFTSDVTITATTVGAAGQIVTAGAITYEAVPHLIEFYCPQATQGAAQNFLVLRDGTTVLGTIARFASGVSAAPVYAVRRLTPSAASHSYNFASWNAAAGTWVYQAGTGGTAGDTTTDLPGFIRVSRVPT